MYHLRKIQVIGGARMIKFEAPPETRLPLCISLSTRGDEMHWNICKLEFHFSIKCILKNCHFVKKRRKKQLHTEHLKLKSGRGNKTYASRKLKITLSLSLHFFLLNTLYINQQLHSFALMTFYYLKISCLFYIYRILNAVFFSE